MFALNHISFPAERNVGSDCFWYRRLLDNHENNPTPPPSDFDLARDTEAMNRMGHLLARKFFCRQSAVTAKGYMALVPPGAREGDTVVVFAGARTAHLLREVEGGERLGRWLVICMRMV